MVGEMHSLRDSTYLCHCPRGTERQLQIQHCGVSVIANACRLTDGVVESGQSNVRDL